MRYRIGEDPQTMTPVDQPVFTGVGVFGFFLGIGFVIAGWRGKQYWLAIWGAMLTCASAAYVAYNLTQ